MPADEHREEAAPPSPEVDDNASPPESSQPEMPLRKRRRYLTRRNALFATLGIAAISFVLILAAIFLYRSGRVDRLLARQLKETLAEYGIRAEIGSLETLFSPRQVVMRDVTLYNSQTGEKLAHVRRLVATVRIEDLFALSLRRNINLESLEIYNPKVWVTFDEEGRSNFRNLRLPPPDPNRRILFSYSTARIKVQSGAIHFDDELHEISGEARNLTATIKPEDANAPAASAMNVVNLTFSDSTFVFDGNPVNDISLALEGRINQESAIIDELILRSPVAETRVEGTIKDLRELAYELRVESTVNLTRVSDVLLEDSNLRGAGRFAGTITGAGTGYRVDGQFESDALAAYGVRLQNANASAILSGDGKAYEAQGRAVAELLTAGDFRLNAVQLAGQVMGTGTDFRWLGELRAAAVRSGKASISDLILSDVMAETRGDVITARAERAAADRLIYSGARIDDLRALNVRAASENGTQIVSAERAVADSITTSDARISSVIAQDVTAVNRNGVTRVEVDGVRVGGVRTAGAQTGSINIAGVRLAIRESGRVEGRAGDVNVGTITFDESVGGGGRVEDVRLGNPVFTLEPAGRYRASADLSLGGGVLGEARLGRINGGLIATNDQVQLKDFTAEISDGSAKGDITLSTRPAGESQISASFTNLQIGKLLPTLSGNVMPVTGEATGNLNLTFPGTNFKAASGELNARIEGEAGDDAGGRTPVSGDVALRAERGSFEIARGELRAGNSGLKATGQFSFEGDSNLQLELASNDAAELQRVLVSTGLVPELATNLEDYGVELAGNLNFDGTVRGRLSEPVIDGRASLGSLVMGGRDLGSLAASIDSTPTKIRLTDGRLIERDGGGSVQFTASIPRTGENNISLSATFNQYDAENLLAVLPEDIRARLGDVRSELSGSINVTGFPRAMDGGATLRFGAGSIAGQAFEEIAAQLDFDRSIIELENLVARLPSGRVTASGAYNTESEAFNLQARGEDIRLNLLERLVGGVGRPPQLSGTIDLTATASGILTNFSTYQVALRGEGRDVKVNNRPAGTLALVGRTENGQLNLEFTTGLLGELQTITARVNLNDKQLPFLVNTNLTGADLTPLFAALLPEAANVSVRGRTTGAIQLSGNLLDEEGAFTLADLNGTARFTEFAVQVEDVMLAAESPVTVRFGEDEIFFERTRFTGENTNIVFGGTFALSEKAAQNLTVDGAVNLRVLKGFSPDLFLSGLARLDLSLTGTYAEPRLSGAATVSSASLSSLIRDERISVSSIDGRIIFTSNQAEIASLTGKLGNGRVAVSGGVSLAGAQAPQFHLVVRGENVNVPFPEDFRTAGDFRLVVQGSRQAQFITGTVDLRRAEYTEEINLEDFLDRRPESEITAGTASDGVFGATTRLDIRVQGSDALIVRNNLADVVGSLALQIRGSLANPAVSGRITATRGTINFRRDNRYELTRAVIELPAQADVDPLLNIQAESEIKGYRVLVNLSGSLTAPQVSVRSDPALPQGDVVSLITTGDLQTGLTTASTLAQTGLGTAASLLTDTFVNAPVRRATDRLFGLNEFEIDPGIGAANGRPLAPRLTVGRKINRNLTITYATYLTGAQNQVAAVEYRVSNRFSLVARYAQGDVSNLSASQHIFSFEVRFRKRF